MRKDWIIMFALSMIGMACERPAYSAAKLPVPSTDLTVPATGGEQTLVLAGGCFWCVEAVFERLDGVKDVVSGYAGDGKANANYEAVGRGQTRHAEVVKITYDPAKISFGELLRVFFVTHDPTTLNRQGPDSGPQYRSAIFYETEEQKQVAAAYIKQLGDAKAFSRPIVTTLEPLGAGFFPAEQYHQDYVQLHPDNPYIQQNVPAKLKKLSEQFGDKLKGATTQPAK